METSNLLNAEFKTLVLRTLSELRGRVDELNENFNKEIGNTKMEIEDMKKKQSKMKNALAKMMSRALTGMAQLDEHRATKQKFTSSIPGQGTCLGCKPNP